MKAPNYTSCLQFEYYYSLSLATLILHFLLSQERRHLYMKRRNNSRIVRVETFCNVFKLYANSHNNTKLNYTGNSIIAGVTL